ncbi:unnamed protein product [Effrenium voratum]|nr:unnamed protein product [Effrenium voratum]
MARCGGLSQDLPGRSGGGGLCWSASDGSDGPASEQGDPDEKLEVYAALDPLALERRCRNRGLWSVSWNQIPPSKSMLLQRLRVFEDYWSVRSKSSGAAQPALPQVQDDLDGTPVEASQRAPRIS